MSKSGYYIHKVSTGDRGSASAEHDMEQTAASGDVMVKMGPPRDGMVDEGVNKALIKEDDASAEPQCSDDFLDGDEQLRHDSVTLELFCSCVLSCSYSSVIHVYNYISGYNMVESWYTSHYMVTYVFDTVTRNV